MPLATVRPSATSAAIPIVSRPAISRHLRVLQEAHLVSGEARGRQNVYRVTPEGFSEVRHYLERFWDEALPRFALVAENLNEEEEG